MLNFTEEIKYEIIENGIQDEKCLLAFLSAYIRTSGSVVSRLGEFGFEIITENERTADFISDLLEHRFGVTLTVADAKYDRFSGRDKMTFVCIGNAATELLGQLKILDCSDGGFSVNYGIDAFLIGEEETRRAYVIGAFLGGGSCTLPEEQTYSRTGYHFEVVFSNKHIAGDFCELLCDFEILAKLVYRKDNSVVYVKSKEVISDLLNVMSVENCRERLNKIVELKDKTNNENRINNCSVSNIDKTVTASVAQIRAIETISQTIGLQSLGQNLFEVAEARLADTGASMQELADRLKITKSCLNHRMRKIVQIANQLQ